MSDFETWTSAEPLKTTTVLSAEERRLLPTAKRWVIALLRGFAFCLLAPFRLLMYVFTHMDTRSALNAGEKIQSEYDARIEADRRFHYYHDPSSPEYIAGPRPEHVKSPGDQFK